MTDTSQREIPDEHQAQTSASPIEVYNKIAAKVELVERSVSASLPIEVYNKIAAEAKADDRTIAAYLRRHLKAHFGE